MKPLRLYIDNFMCYETGFIDFTQFNSALIIGCSQNNELTANAVGKTTIFKALEYVLFNQADINLEKVIRDDENYCQIVFDFLILDQEYRISRKRTKKGTSDLSLFQRNSSSLNEETYHIHKNNIVIPITNNDSWKDISGRRAQDTEKELEKLIKINFKAFRSTVHFVQNDLMGLATATPENRKKILKDALNLLLFAKLEKIAKEKSGSLTKNMEKYSTLIENIIDSPNSLSLFNNSLLKINQEIDNKSILLNNSNNDLLLINNQLSLLNNEYLSLENKLSDLLTNNKQLLSEKSRLEISSKEYFTKKNNVITQAKNLVAEAQNIQTQINVLEKIDFLQIEKYISQVSEIKENFTKNNILIQNASDKISELSIPIPKNGFCNHCRQILSEEHRKICQDKINSELLESKNIIQIAKSENISSNANLLILNKNIADLQETQQKLKNLNSSLILKNSEIKDKKSLHEEYSNLHKKFVFELDLKSQEISKNEEDLQKSSLSELNKIKDSIELTKKQSTEINVNLSVFNKDIAHLTNNKAVIIHNIEQKSKDVAKLLELQELNKKLEEEYKIYPLVIEAFSSVGISNEIIQNVLDDLQIETNNLLSQLKPGLQLSWLIEKTVEKTGDQADTLDIKYILNGRERYYEQLSGAQKLAVSFSLKLGLSIVLHNMIGADIKFLLLDEIDQSLDKASIDAYADMIKFLQKDFTILVITHNDRLKEKFKDIIWVEQDINMVSKVQVLGNYV